MSTFCISHHFILFSGYKNIALVLSTKQDPTTILPRQIERVYHPILTKMMVNTFSYHVELGLDVPNIPTVFRGALKWAPVNQTFQVPTLRM